MIKKIPTVSEKLHDIIEMLKTAYSQSEGYNTSTKYLLEKLILMQFVIN